MSKKYNKYDILEVVWLDSHSSSGWQTPRETERWIERANNDFLIKTIGYFVQEDEDFIRLCQGYDHQGKNPGGELDDNKDGLFAIAKPCIKNIKIIKRSDYKN